LIEFEAIAQNLVQIWKKQAKDEDFVFLSKKNLANNNWKDTPLRFNKDIVSMIVKWLERNPPNENNLYYCPLPFSKPQRHKEYVKGSRYLWSDMDKIKIKNLPLPPTLYWESSPGRWQGLWELDRFLKPQEAEVLNKRLTYMMGADKGGWDLTQVLRIPGTINHKYKNKPRVGKVIKSNKMYLSDALHKALKPPEDEVSFTLSSTPNLDCQEILLQYREKIDRQALSLLLKETATVGKRSEILWYLENKLLEAGLSPTQVFVLIKNSAWNKYKGRADEDFRLKTELEKIISGKIKEVTTDKPVCGKQEEDEEEPPKSVGLRIEGYREVMSNLRSHPGWLVEGFWMRRSHGIVAGEPKSFKSILTLDLAISVASGKPFLGQYPILEKGPVIIIQNENSDWIMKDRIEKMIVSKGLGGTLKLENRRLRGDFPPNLPLYFVNQQGFLLNDPLHQQLVEKIVGEYKPVLVMFDPLYLMFDGDVNSAKDLSPILNWMLGLKHKYNTGIIVVHHWKKGESKARGGQRMLGSTTLHGWVESAWYIKIQENPTEDVEVEADNSDESIIQSSSNPASLIIEREFRAGGTRSKLEAIIKLGELGDSTYQIGLKKHMRSGNIGNIRNKVVTDELLKSIINMLELHKGPVSQRQLAEEAGTGRKSIKKALDILAEEGRVNITKEGAVYIPEL